MIRASRARCAETVFILCSFQVLFCIGFRSLALHRADSAQTVRELAIVFFIAAKMCQSEPNDQRVTPALGGGGGGEGGEGGGP
jgi:hypothetical protein